MTVSVQLFAMLKERAGRDRIEVELAEGATISDLLDELSELVGAMPVRVAVNREYSVEDTALQAGDELALIPPVSGGSDITDRMHAFVSEAPLSLERISRAVVRDGAGAVVSFQGITREVERLEYEAYAEMATERIEAILSDCLREYRLEAIAAEHRVGAVPLGESSVIVAASSAHRSEAFEGAREAIDRIKAEVPIWKREIDGEESTWVQGTTPD